MAVHWRTPPPWEAILDPKMTTFGPISARSGHYEGKTVVAAQGGPKGRTTFGAFSSQMGHFPLETVMRGVPGGSQVMPANHAKQRKSATFAIQKRANSALNLRKLAKSRQKTPNDAK